MINPLLREKILDFTSVFVFLIFFSGSVYLLDQNDFQLSEVTVLDLVILLLASFRMIRMLLYEKVFSLIRKFINDRWENPLIHSIGNLLSCPWCTGVWTVLFVFDIHYLVPYGNYLNYILAISVIASLLVIATNNLNLKNEILKQQKDRNKEI